MRRRSTACMTHRRSRGRGSRPGSNSCEGRPGRVARWWREGAGCWIGENRDRPWLHSARRSPDFPSPRSRPTPDISLNAINHGYRDSLIAHIRKEVGDDPELVKKAVPSYPPYGKRMLRDNHWYRMLTRPNVDLVIDPIDHVGQDRVVTRDGKE